MTDTRKPNRIIDPEGHAIVEVPLANWPEPARLYAEDYDHLQSLGFGGSWTYNENGTPGERYVRASCTLVSGALVTVSRLIAGVGNGKIVKYRDRNRLNLRRDNLHVVNGRGAAREEGALLIAGIRAAIMARQNAEAAAAVAA